MVRATTTGISAVIAPNGHITARTPSGEATLTARISLVSGTTLYQRMDDAPWWVAPVMAAAWASREAVLNSAASRQASRGVAHRRRKAARPPKALR